MNPISFVPDSGPNYKLYYLVPASFIYLFYHLGGQYLLVLGLIGLIGVITRHSVGESVYGPDAKEENDLSSEREIRRIGTLLFRDKVPAKYSANSWWEMVNEGTLQSTFWGLAIGLLSVFQFSVAILYLFAVYLLVANLLVIDFIGGILLFGLIGLVVHGFIRLILPNISQMDDIPQIDQELQTIVEGFSHTLYGSDIVATEAGYGADRGGIFEIDIKREDESEKPIQETINQIAICFCSVVDRSSYPITRSDFRLKRENDDVAYFSIDAKWCREVSDGQMSTDEFFRRVGLTVSVKEPDGEIVAHPISQD